MKKLQSKCNTEIINDLYDYENRFIIQNDNYFKFSLDSILLAEFVNNVKKNDVIVDFCSGNAAIPLILSTKFDNKIIGVELQEEIYNMAIKSIKLNKLESKINIINDNVKNINNLKCDIITCNPPYFKYSSSSLINSNDILAIARHEIEITLEEIFMKSKELLSSKGTLYISIRPERLDEVIYLGNKYNINVKNIQIITTGKQNVSLLLIKAVNNSKIGIKFNKIIDIKDRKTYKNIFD